MLPVKLDRPLAVLDIESTGINPRTDRIVELAIVKLLPDNGREIHTWRFNPEMPIPPEVTAIHHISDADVANCPTFRALAPRIYILLDGCDLGGYNIGRFDLPMLTEEFLRASIHFSGDGRRVVDAQRIFHRREPRDLTAALAFYCHETHFDAHGAEADALATVRVLEGQFERYADLPRTVAELDAYCTLRDPMWADREGRLKNDKGEILINFGKKKGESLYALARHDPGFLKWILRGDFPSDTKEIVQRALEGKRVDPLGSVLSEKLGGGKG